MGRKKLYDFSGLRPAEKHELTGTAAKNCKQLKYSYNLMNEDQIDILKVGKKTYVIRVK